MADPIETGPGAVNKGGGYRSGPKRWTGKGPAPARHIPWPEIFKHHISLIEGHHKMIDMVRKHTVEGTGNHRTICEMLDRCKSMLYETKSISKNFVPPANQRDQVPVGSSSASMYPGYSPADHVYGSAAMEAGQAAAAARKAGIELKPPVEIEYEVGQGRGLKRKKLADIKAAKASQQDNEGRSDQGTDAPAPATNSHRQDAEPTDAQAVDTKPTAGSTESTQPAFFVDTKPTPVNLPFTAKPTSKRPSLEPEPLKEVTAKKLKEKHDGDIPNAPEPGQMEKEDISAEVEKRMKEKEEKRRKKHELNKEKKRKRETEGSSALAADPATAVVESKKPKKKSKKDHSTKEAEEASKKRPSDTANVSADGEAIKKKRKKHKDDVAEM